MAQISGYWPQARDRFKAKLAELEEKGSCSRLKKIGYGWGNRVKYALAQEFTNRAILTQVANRSKAASAASEYLESVKERFPKALELQCIPTDQSLWELERYEDFLSEGRALLAQHL